MKKTILIFIFLMIANINFTTCKINLFPKVLSALVMYKVITCLDQNKIENWLIGLEAGENEKSEQTIKENKEFRTQFGIFIRVGLTILSGIISKEIFTATFEEPKILY